MRSPVALLGTALLAQPALAQPVLTRPADYKRLNRIAADLMAQGKILGLAYAVIERGQRCIVILPNSGGGARILPPLGQAALDETGMPWTWEYNPLKPVKAP